MRSPVLALALGAVVLPFALSAIGLTLTSSTDCAIFVMVALGLNLLLGYTGLASFGHGAWFGVGAYAVGILQRDLFPGGFAAPFVGALAIVLAAATVFGALILRRRGVYFSLLTLALTAILFAIAFRWTAMTGGESGLGGIVRPVVLGADLADPRFYYAVVATVGVLVAAFLWRVVNSPFGAVLVAIRENETRARFMGYPTDRYKLGAFALSAAVAGLGGALSAFHHRFASADPLLVSFSGEMLAMVIIGGMRSFAGPAIGALFYILFREFLSIWTPHWLFWFGLLFAGFILFSPRGLVGLWRRVRDLVRPPPSEASAMGGGITAGEARPLPAFLADAAAHADDGAVLVCAGVGKRFGGIVAIEDASVSVAGRGIHALIGPNGAGKTTLFNLASGMFAPDGGSIRYRGEEIAGHEPQEVAARGLARSFQITNLFPGLSVRENLRLGIQARDPKRFGIWTPAAGLARVEVETDALAQFLGLETMQAAPAESLSYGGQRLVDLGIALAAKPGLLLLDEPLAGLAQAQRDRVADLVRRLGGTIGVLIVEHDIDRVLELADRVTVMNQGRVLVEGAPAEVRADERVREVYIGSGTAAVAARAVAGRREIGATLLAVETLDAFYGKSHILHDVSLGIRTGQVLAVLGRNGAGKSTLLKAVVGIVRPQGTVRLGGETISGRPPEEIARLGVGFVPQGRRLFPGLSVRDNLMLGRLKRGGGTSWSDERIFEYFPRIRERLDVAADYLSGGEQQMVAIARALAGNVQLLLLDEPFEGLSPAITEEVFGAIDRLRHEIAIAIVDHNLDLVLALADETVVLDRGTIAHRGPAAPLREDLALRRRVLWV